ncbi:MAG: hypothetical protein IJY06_03380 [Oscillospiraceae bacterium]|nr:hypothetical protein [Oscillospiraceae bacterium]
MNIKKTLVAVASYALVGAVAVGGTLAYLSDRGTSTSAYTFGEIEIELIETYKQGAQLLPGVNIQKEVSIKNTGENDAWVWYTYAVPKANQDYLQVNIPQNTGWTTEKTPAEQIINGEECNVYVVYHEKMIQSGEETGLGMSSVTLDYRIDYNKNDGKFYLVENGKVTPISNFDPTDYKVYVTAYGIQDTDSINDVQGAYKTFMEQWTGDGSTLPDVNYAGPVVVNTAQELYDALVAAGSANAGDSTICITKDIDLTNFDWTPVKVDGYHGADVVTVEGCGNTLYGLDAPLFAGGFAGGSGIVINELTIADSDIVSTNGDGSGAFIETVDSMQVITLTDCHLLNSTVTGSRTGGLVGWTSGYNDVNDGPVKTYVTIEDCSVIGNTITGSGSVGGINGHAGANDWTYTTIKNCTVENNEIISTDDGDWRTGVVVGTANVGHVVIENVTESGNTLTQTGKTAPENQSSLYGRFVPGKTGTLVIDGEDVILPVKITGTDATEVNDAFKAAATAEKKQIVIDLDADVTYDVNAWEANAMGGSITEKIVINANGHKITFNQLNSDWSNIVTNGAVLEINDAAITNSGHNDGPWNRHDLNFACDVVMNNVTSDKAVAFKAGAQLTNVTISDANTSDTYAIWIQPRGQEVTLNGCTIDMIACTDGRGIKIDNQYLGSGEEGKVTLNVSDTVFKTEEKSAILVNSTFGADVNLSNVDITGVAADSTNEVWVDSAAAAYADLVTVTGGNKIDEP